MNRAGRGRVRHVSDTEVVPIALGWELASCPPAALADPLSLGTASLRWLRADGPRTVAASLRAAGQWSLDGPTRRFDAEDWWYRATFPAEPPQPGEALWLVFDGLATVADVWLNGTAILASRGMFTAHRRRVDHLLHADNELVLRFRALDPLLEVRNPRPRWRAPMVEHQQLRWYRTTLLGRTPGWSPPAACVGPWRGVRLERRRGVSFHDVRLSAGADGVLHVSCEAATDEDSALGVDIVVVRDGREHRAPLRAGDGLRWDGAIVVPEAECWWPHTHGESPLYQASLLARHRGGVSRADLGSIGFRDVTVRTEDGDFAVSVNGARVFCRGACWTPLDPVGFTPEPAALETALAQVTDCGMNMLRVCGPMVYETDEFLDACDARGVMLWQDFMFANMDYPESDPEFSSAVRIEAEQQLARWQGRPSLAVVCGNSEAEQQAAMWGASRDRWAPALFHTHLAGLSRTMCPAVHYTPSSAHGGAFPHQANVGATSYYGVGAYLRPLEDARRAEVRFASECLAFANVPATRSGLLATAKVHDPVWKGRVPRDRGAGWDFDDVRDHYVASLFRVDPVALRSADHDRYLALGSVATGEVMAAVFAEWRRARSVTRGGLIWFLRDLWDGAGWGVVGARGEPKAAWYYLRRALSPIGFSISDEGGNGLAVHVVNDTPRAFAGDVAIDLIRQGELRVAHGTRSVSVGAHAAVEHNALAWFDGFFDLSYAYRFGPPSHDLVSATLRDDAGTVVGRAFHFVGGLPNQREGDLGLSGALCVREDATCSLTVASRRFAHAVRVTVDGFAAEDNYFHVAPGETRQIALRRVAAPTSQGIRGSLQPLNAEGAAVVTVRA
jgi:beta-mannosidase